MTTDTETRTFFGIPIEGEPRKTRTNINQLPIEDLQPLLQAALDDPNIKEFGWTQYTPYFNDGEECIFSVNGLFAVPVGIVDEQIEEDYMEWGYRPTFGDGDDDRWGTQGSVWNPETNRYDRNQPYVGSYPEAYEILTALDSAIQTGAYDDALYDTFGDHTEVLFTGTKIVLEEYNHD